MDNQKTASALKYEQGESVPTLVATGQGDFADKIIALAEEAGIPIRQDPVLAQALSSLQMGSEVPPELYIAVAEALVWAWRLDNQN